MCTSTGGLALAGQGRHEAAIEEYRKALKLENEEPERLHKALAVAMIKLGDYEGAASSVQEALTLGLTGLLDERAKSFIESSADSAR
jgi:Flp pilus assembly protein TadD